MSAELVNRLEMAVEASQRTRRELNELAEQTAAAPASMVAQLRRARSLAEEVLHDLGTETKRPVRVEEIEREREALPRPLREAYELLYCRAYGTAGAVSVGDATVIRGIGKREARTDTGTPEGRGGAAQPATKRFGQSRRNVVLDQRAYALKINYDRRLRRIAKEIADDLSGVDGDSSINVCSRCARIGEYDWRHCPNCGHRMELQARD